MQGSTYKWNITHGINNQVRKLLFTICSYRTTIFTWKTSRLLSLVYSPLYRVVLKCHYYVGLVLHITCMLKWLIRNKSLNCNNSLKVRLDSDSFIDLGETHLKSQTLAHRWPIVVSYELQLYKNLHGDPKWPPKSHARRRNFDP